MRHELNQPEKFYWQNGWRNLKQKTKTVEVWMGCLPHPISLWHLNTWSPVGECLGRIRRCDLAKSVSLGADLMVSKDSMLWVDSASCLWFEVLALSSSSHLLSAVCPLLPTVYPPLSWTLDLWSCKPKINSSISSLGHVLFLFVCFHSNRKVTKVKGKTISKFLVWLVWLAFGFCPVCCWLRQGFV